MTIMARNIRDSYLGLVRKHPLIPIRNEKQCDEALSFLKKLVIRDESSLDEGERAYIEALTQFVEDYEDEHYKSQIAEMAPLEALKFLMHENGMTPADLGRVLGNRSLASQILRGRRALSKAHIRLLSRRFNVDPGLFFEKG